MLYKVICEQFTKSGKKKTIYYWCNKVQKDNRCLLVNLTNDKTKKIKNTDVVKIKKYKIDKKTYLGEFLY